MKVSRLKKIWWFLVIPIILLVVARLCLSPFLKWYVNRTLDKIPGYYGKIENVRVHLWRGAYEIDELKLLKVKGQERVPFFSLRHADLSIQWRELFHGALVGKIILEKPDLNFIVAPSAEESQTSIDESWQDRVQELFPVDINYFHIENGSIHFQNLAANPPVDVYMTDFSATAENLSNSRKRYEKLMATLVAHGKVMQQGVFDFNVKFNPFETQPTFQLQAVINQLRLPAVNSFLKHYAGVEAKKGTINLYSEMAAKEGGFRGYAKPFMHDLEFASFPEKDLKFSEKVKGMFANFAAWLLKNPKKQSDASKIEFSGRFDAPKIRTWEAIKFAFHHAYVQALSPRLEHTITENTGKPKK